MKDLRKSLAIMFRQFAMDIEEMTDEELQERVFLIQKIRADLEAGRYDTEVKYSDFNWRI